MIVMEFDDEWGHHKHVSYGPPYDAKKPLTCAACVVQFEHNRDKWRAEFTVKYKLPEGFWL